MTTSLLKCAVEQKPQGHEERQRTLWKRDMEKDMRTADFTGNCHHNHSHRLLLLCINNIAKCYALNRLTPEASAPPTN